MYSNVVKIICGKECFGTGIVISPEFVLTAEHVIASETDDIFVVFNDKRFKGRLSKKDKYVALIEIISTEFSQLFSEQTNRLDFTNQEILSSEQKWTIEGFVSHLQEKHCIGGNGFYSSSNKLLCDYEVGQIITGTMQDYSGLSGAPVICNNRAVGIVQIQQADLSGKLGIGFTSIAMFEKFIPNAYLTTSNYLSELLMNGYRQSSNEVKKNIDSKKYIPDIFVEDSDYKEYLRYFCDPILFIKKTIEDLNSFDFSQVNEYFSGKEICFSNFDDNIFPNDCEQTYKLLKDKIKKSILMLKHHNNNLKEKGAISLEHFYKKNSVFNNSLQFDLEDIYRHIEYFDKRIVLLTKNAGQGKTNFLCDFTENFLLKKGIPTFFFNASSFVEKPSTEIIKKLSLNGRFSVSSIFQQLEKFWEKTGKFVVIVIDGLNENSTLSNFGKYVEESIKELLAYPYLKIIMSTRNELLDKRFGNLCPNLFDNLFVHISMNNFRSEKIKERIFNGYLNFFNISVNKSSLSLSSYDQLCNNTLLLRFFCEVNQNKKQVHLYDIYHYSLFSRYYALKKAETTHFLDNSEFLFDSLLNKISNYMISNEKFYDVPLAIFNSDEIRLLNYLLENDVIFKKETDVKKGFLISKDYILSFTFDEFRDFCLTMYLVKNDDAEKSFPIYWNQMHKNSWSSLEGIEKYVFYLSKTQYLEISKIIKNEPMYSNLYWNCIWNLEDKDISEEDIELWKSHFYSVGDYIKKIFLYFLHHNDRGYFKNTPIDLLFYMFFEVSKNPSKYDEIIHTLFPLKGRTKFSKKYPLEKSICYCDELIDYLKNSINTDGNSPLCKDLLKLSLLIYHIYPKEICDLWLNSYSIFPQNVLCAFEYYCKLPSEYVFIKHNYRALVNDFLVRNSDSSFYEYKFHSFKKYDYKKKSLELNLIWQ